MPVELSTFELPGGTRCVRIVTRGHLSKEDAETILERTGPGGPLFGMPQLVLTQQQESADTESRAAFLKRTITGELEPWTAMVVTHPVGRVAASFLIRVAQKKRTKVFRLEAEAVQWLDERLRETKGPAGA